MIEIRLPTGTVYSIEHLVFDYNGTLAVDGALNEAVPARFERLAKHATLHVVTADTFGLAASELDGLPCSLSILAPTDQVRAKAEYVRSLGADMVAAFGNGRNDTGMLGSAAIGVALVRDEGASIDALKAADVVCTSIEDALDLFLNTRRLIATLRH